MNSFKEKQRARIESIKRDICPDCGSYLVDDTKGYDSPKIAKLCLQCTLSIDHGIFFKYTFTENKRFLI